MSDYFTVYNKDYDGFWYNSDPSSPIATSWTDDLRHAQFKHTIADTFALCCKLYEREMFSLDSLLVVEVTVDIANDDFQADFENPVWIGNTEKMTGFWDQVEDELKPLLIRGLFQDGLQKMHKIVNAWHHRELQMRYTASNR